MSGNGWAGATFWQQPPPNGTDPLSLRRTVLATAALFAMTSLSDARSEEVGEIDVDWLGNDIIVEAIEDPKVTGVTCHVAFFERGIIDRLQKGQIFTDPSNSSIACRQTGPITIGDIERDEEGEEVFSTRTSLFIKEINVTRIFDEKRQTLIYLAHGKRIQNGSAKMSISTVPLYGQKVEFTQ